MAKQTFTTGQVLTAAQMTSLQQTAMGGGEATAKTASYTLVALDAGSTVIMNSGSATTITVNTALFVAGDTVNIQNIGAGVCTITAGTATVNTAGSLALAQYEGGVLYFRSTSASTFFDYVQAGATSPLTTKGDLYGFSTLDARIPIGTNNQVLTADSAQALGLKWATPASGGMTLLSTTAFSGATTAEVTGISTAYTNLQIHVSNLAPATSGQTISFQLGTTGYVTSFGLTVGGGGTAFASNAYASATINSVKNFDSGASGVLDVLLPLYSDTNTRKLCNYTFGLNLSGDTSFGAAWTNVSGAITQFKLIGTSNIQGTILIYGVK